MRLVLVGICHSVGILHTDGVPLAWRVCHWPVLCWFDAVGKFTLHGCPYMYLDALSFKGINHYTSLSLAVFFHCFFIHLFCCLLLAYDCCVLAFAHSWSHGVLDQLHSFVMVLDATHSFFTRMCDSAHSRVHPTGVSVSLLLNSLEKVYSMRVAFVCTSMSSVAEQFLSIAHSMSQACIACLCPCGLPAGTSVLIPQQWPGSTSMSVYIRMSASNAKLVMHDICLNCA